MFRPVTLPLWLFVLILAFAGTAFLSHFLFPSVRWFFRRRMERVVERLNRRLAQPIQPFKLMRRPDMIVRLVHDPKVAEAIAGEAAATGVPETVQLERARRYAREIVPAFSATVYFGFAARAAKWLARLVYRVQVGRFDAAALEGIDKDATVVFVMNHRSNMDYVLVTYLAASRSALAYAVGEWARVWPLSWLIRASGAYFIRRRALSPLYRRVLARYVQMATEEGVAQAVFPEGGLSLDGRVGRAKLGVLSYIVAGHRPGGRDVVFVPVSLAYDRVIEDRVLTAALASGDRRFRAGPGAVLRFLGRQLGRALTGRFRKFGTAAVSFGAPLSLAAFLRSPHEDVTAALAAELMRRIAANVTVLPVPLLCATLEGRETMDEGAVRAEAGRLAARLSGRGIPIGMPGDSVDAGIDRALDILALRKVIRREDGSIVVPPKDRALIGFYAGAVGQHLAAAAESAGEDCPSGESAET